MGAFDLTASLENARRRLPPASRTSRRRPRTDRGRTRLDPRLVRNALRGQDRPQLVAVSQRRPLGRAVADLPYWLVIGGQAMRCFLPYRPSRDVDFGVYDRPRP